MKVFNAGRWVAFAVVVIKPQKDESDSQVVGLMGHSEQSVDAPRTRTRVVSRTRGSVEARRS